MTGPAPAPASVAPDPALERVVVGYDASDGADAAAAFAMWLAGHADVEVTLLHACPTPERAPSADLLPAAAEQVVAYEREWQGRLDELRAQGAPDGLVDCRLERGSAAGALIAAAIETGADVIAVGSHGVGRVRASLLGSVSSQVLLHAPSSVMLFPTDRSPAHAAHARAVLVGIDGSRSAAHALRLAQALAVPLDARLVLIHVADPHMPFVSVPTTAMRHELRRHGRRVLHEARGTVAAPLDVVEEELVEGNVPDELVAACTRHAPAVMLLGSRGLGGFRELLLGSAPRWVANHAPCPVLVARPPAATP